MKPLALSRPVDDEDRRIVRHACGYGCVRCAATIYQYRTVDGGDELDDIVLLCPPCAHALNGRPGATRALRVMRSNPLPRQQQFDRRKLPYAHDIPDMTVVPGVTMRKTAVPIQFGGIPVLRFRPPELPGAAIGISIALGRAGMEPRPIVISNEWLPDDEEDDWLFERPGNRYIVSSRDKTAQITLAIITPQLLVLELLRTHSGGSMLESGLHGTRLDGVMQVTPVVKYQIVGMAI